LDFYGIGGLILNKPLVVLKALLEGYPVEITPYVYRLDSDYELCIEGFNTSTRKVALLKTHFSLRTFLELCNRLTDDEVFLIGANTVLNKVKGGS
jgi:hypothetical protein